MKYILIIFCLCCFTAGYTQSSVNIGPGVQVTASGNIKTILGSGSFINNGTYTAGSGAMIIQGPVSFSGNGVTNLYNLTINAQGMSEFNAPVSVLSSASFDVGTLNAGSDQLYIRTDLNASANVTVEGIMTGSIKGLIVKATNMTGACPSFTSTLSLNISGSALLYQWQSSSDSLTWNDISGATTATYLTTVNSNSYYRCNLTTSNSPYNQATPGTLLTLSGPPPTITTHPSNNATCINSFVSFEVAASDGPVSFTWQESIDGGNTWNALSDIAPYTGSDSNVLTISPVSAFNGYQYRAVATNACGFSIPSDAAVLIVHDLPAVSGGSDQTICTGSSTILSGSGAQSYTWNNDVANGVAFTPASTNTYTVTGTDEFGCSNTDQVTRTLFSPALNPGGTIRICQLDTATIAAPAGSGYTWSRNGSVISGSNLNSLAVNVNGSYTVTYTDDICGVSTLGPTILKKYPLTPKPVVTPIDTTICSGDSVQFTGSLAVQYEWLLNGVAIPGATEQSYTTSLKGDYRIKVVDGNGCTSAPSVLAKLKVLALPNPDFIVNTVKADGSLILTGSRSSASYQWILADDPIPGATNRNYRATVTGYYSLKVTGSTGCSATSADTFITINYTGLRSLAEIEEQSAGSEINILPNPSSGVFHIVSDNPLKAIVLDMQGRIVLAVDQAKDIDLTGEAAGVYVLQLFNMEGTVVKQERLLKE
jgi:hypothetical protein